MSAGEAEIAKTPPPLRRALAPLRSAYDVVLGEPMKEGRLSLRGLDATSHQLAVGGLVALAGMLVSLLLNESWRRGALVNVGTTSDPALLPRGLVPVTLAALAAAWLVIVWGAFRASFWVRLAVASLFLALDAALSRPQVVAVDSSPALTWTPDLALATYAAVPAVLVLAPAACRRDSVGRYLRPVALGALVAATLLFFGASLWAQRGQLDAGIPLTIPGQLGGALVAIEALLLPMVFVSVLSIVGLSYSITEAVSGPFWRLGPTAARALLALLLGVKIWRELGGRPHEWLLYVQQRPGATIRTLLGLALLASLALLARRLRPRERASEEIKESVAYAGALALAVPLLIEVVVYTAQEFLIVAFSAGSGSVTFPADWLSVSSPVLWALVLAVAVWLLVRSRGSDSPAREAGLGLAVMAVWAEFLFLPEAFHYDPGFDPVLLDAALTVAVAVYLALRWRALGTRSAVWLGALLGFSWLVSTRDDLVTMAGNLVGAPTAAVLAVGVAYALLTDSEFTARTSAALPRSARPLLWVGYLLLSATLANWVLASHQGDPIEGPTRRAFEFLGLPLAAWLLSWRPFARVGTYEEDEEA